MSNNNGTQNWVVTDNGSWDILWQRSVAYYWDNEAACDAKGDKKLFYIFKQLGVSNIQYEGKGIVSFLDHLPGHPNKKYVIIMVKIKFNNDCHFCGNDKPEYVWQRAYMPENGWTNLAIDLTIKVPAANTPGNIQTSALSDFVAMGRYFPFSTPFVQPDDSTGTTNVPVDIEIDDLQDPEPSACRIHCREADNEDANNSLAQEGDRGGAEGLNDDYLWLHFAPRMVSYNWAETADNKIRNNSSLSCYPIMLENLNYTMAPEINVIVQYADKLPCTDGVYNINEYASLLEIDFPVASKSIKAGYNPIALADLIANRANQPFTSC